MDIRNR